MDGKDAANQQRLQSRDRHILAVAVAQAVDPLLARYNSQNGGRTGLVREARRTQSDVQTRALQAIGPGVLELIDASVLQPLQLVLEIRPVQGEAGVELQRSGVDLRRQCPTASLELLGDDPIEIHHVEGYGDHRNHYDSEGAEPE